MNQTKKSSTLKNIVIGISAGVTVVCLCLGFAALSSAGKDKSAVTPETEKSGATVEVRRFTETPAPAAKVPGKTRDNPYPMQQAVDIGGGMELTVLGVERPANDRITQINRFIDTPEPGQEYMIVQLSIKCNKVANETCSFWAPSVKTVGVDGQVRDEYLILSMPNNLETTEFFGGSIIGGGMPFLAVAGDASTVLMYQPLIFGDPVYISLTED